VGITLEDQIFVERGHVAAHPKDGPLVTNRIKANVFWLGRDPLVPDKTYKLKLATQEVDTRVAELVRVIDASSLEDEGVDQGYVGRNDAAELILETKFPVALDLHNNIETVGRFVLVDGWDVAGGGIVISALPTEATAGRWDDDAGLSEEQLRRAAVANEQVGSLLWVTGEDGLVGQFADTLRRALNRHQQKAAILDDDTLRGLNSDGPSSDEARRRALEVGRLLARNGTTAIVVATQPVELDGGGVHTLDLRVTNDEGTAVQAHEGHVVVRSGGARAFTIAGLSALIELIGRK